MELKDSKYHVGDKVRICDTSKCTYGTNKYMEDLIGEIRIIRRVLWNEGLHQYSYHIENDNFDCWDWDDSCFEPAVSADLPEFDASGVDILDLFC